MTICCTWPTHCVLMSHFLHFHFLFFFKLIPHWSRMHVRFWRIWWLLGWIIAATRDEYFYQSWRPMLLVQKAAIVISACLSCSSNFFYPHSVRNLSCFFINSWLLYILIIYANQLLNRGHINSNDKTILLCYASQFSKLMKEFNK